MLELYMNLVAIDLELVGPLTSGSLFGCGPRADPLYSTFYQLKSYITHIRWTIIGEVYGSF